VSAPEPNIARLLIDLGANVNAKTESGNSVLATAVDNCEISLVELLLGKGARIHPPPIAYDYSPIISAARKADDGEILTLLFQKCSHDPTIPYIHREALHAAARYNRLRSMEILLQHGFDPNARHRQTGVTPLLSACRSADRSLVGAARLLLQHGAEATASDPEGNTCRKWLTFSNLHTETDYVAVHLLSWSDWSEIIPLLLKQGIDINARNAKGQTALHSMVSWLHAFPRKSALLCLLIDSGAEVNAADDEGKTVLHYLLQRNQNSFEFLTTAVKYVLKKGADFRKPDKSGQTAFDVTYKKWKWNAATILEQHGATEKDIGPFAPISREDYGPFDLVRLRNVELLDFMLSVGVGKMQDDEGRTPLLFATDSDDPDLDIIRVFLRHGAKNGASHESLSHRNKKGQAMCTSIPSFS
jgi:ankyrin repeat protein